MDGPDDGLADGLEDTAPQLSEQEAAALGEASAWVGGSVVAVGIGRGPDGESAVVVHVDEPAPDLPEQVGGLPVQIIRSGPVQALDEPGA